MQGGPQTDSVLRNDSRNYCQAISGKHEGTREKENGHQQAGPDW